MSHTDKLIVYVSPNGSNKNDGRLPDTSTENDGSGPLGTLEQAISLLSQMKNDAYLPSHVEIQLRGGRYEIDKPITLTHELSFPVTVTAFKKEIPIIDGGVQINNWKQSTVNGVDLWEADLPDVKNGLWHFRSLYVNGSRRERPRLPKKGLYRITDVPGMHIPAAWAFKGYDQFKIDTGKMHSFKNLQDVEVVAFHFWVCERMPIASFDEKTELITTQCKSIAPLVEGKGEKLAPCYLDNVFDALNEPGEWYLSREDGKLYYIPLPGETIENTVVIAPKILQFLKLLGDPRNGEHIEYIHFKKINFQHSDWVQPGHKGDTFDTAWSDPERCIYSCGRRGAASAAQAEADVSGAIYLRGARNCLFEDCRISNTGWYGIDIGDGCQRNAIIGCDFFDLGGGGIKINGASFSDRLPALETGHNRITDCHIHDGGKVFCASVGIHAMHTYCNTFSHNEINDLFYSGISVGWQWDYRSNITRDNIIEFNHIHNLGKGMLSDMGGVYTLGVQPGTVIRNNHIHDIYKLNYGAWCIYTDEGSSHILIENNVCHSTNGDIFHQHYGRDNILRNNIFAFAEDALIYYTTWVKPYNGYRMYKNILLSRGEAFFLAGMQLNENGHETDMNLLWNYAKDDIRFVKKAPKNNTKATEWVLFSEWQDFGNDQHSIIADPKCTDPENFDFSLSSDSPAFKAIGFKAIDLSTVGPRAVSNRKTWTPAHPRK